MGLFQSKRRKLLNKETELQRNISGYDLNKVQVESAGIEDAKIIAIWDKEWQEQPQIFVLNQVLNSILFFVDHSRIFTDQNLRKPIPEEVQINMHELKNEGCHCILLDDRLDEVNKNITFRHYHGELKHFSQPLRRKRIYIIDNSIEDCGEMADYISVDKAYSVSVSEAHHKGYVLLELINKTASKPLEGVQLLAKEETENENATSSEYAYTTITTINQPQPIEIASERRNTLPEVCFAMRKVKNYSVSQDDSEDSLFKNISYLNSQGYFKYFTEEKLYCISDHIGIGEELSESKRIPGKILCHKAVPNCDPRPLEVLPGVEIKWPNIANSFINRPRNTIIAKKNPKEFVRCQWPHNKVIADIIKFPCVAVSKGFQPKKASFADTEIEWEVHFPRAERYLERTMTYAQYSCYLYLLTIYKYEIEPTTKHYGLLPEHLLHHIFWEMEKDYVNWPQHRIGTKLINVIKSLITKLSHLSIPNFFIEDQNMLENIPSCHIEYAQKVFDKIIQLPLMSSLRFLRCLRHKDGKFYPTLNIKELYTILVTSGIEKNHPLEHRIIHNTKDPRRKYQNVEENEYHEIWKSSDKENEWRRKADEIARKNHLKNKENLKKNLKRRESIESIQIDFAYDGEVDYLKNQNLFNFFIELYLAISKKSRDIASKAQVQYFQKLTDYLLRLPSVKLDGYEDKVRELKELFKKEQAEMHKMTEKVDEAKPPDTPVRNSMIFAYPIQQLKSQTIRLHNLDETFQSGTESVVVKKKKINVNRTKDSDPDVSTI